MKKIYTKSDNKERYDISLEMQKIFDDFDGKICIQRNSLRFIKEDFVNKTCEWLKNLE